MLPREFGLENTVQELAVALARVREQTEIVQRLEDGREQNQEISSLCQRMGQAADRIASCLELVRRTTS